MDSDTMSDQEATKMFRPAQFIAISGLSLVLASACVGLRFYVRLVLTKSFGVDDWILLAAWFTFACHVILFTAYGANILVNGITKEEVVSLEILEFHGLLYGLDQVLVKAALAAFFGKVLPRRSWQRIFVIVIFVVFAIYTMSFTLILLFQCGDPLDLSNPTPVCIKDYALMVLSYMGATFNMVMDWIMTLIPITVIWRTQMSRRVKTSVVLIMLLGCLGSIISLLRIPFINMGLFDGTIDGFRKVTPFLFLALWENCVGIMAVSLAALRPLLRRMSGGESSTRGATGGKSPGPGYLSGGGGKGGGSGAGGSGDQSTALSDLSLRRKGELNTTRTLGRGLSTKSNKSESLARMDSTSSQEYLRKYHHSDDNNFSGWDKNGINVKTSYKVDSESIDLRD